jgi:hypothetical protein
MASFAEATARVDQAEDALGGALSMYVDVNAPDAATAELADILRSLKTWRANHTSSP